MIGSLENDYPTGDYVCWCDECYCDFHGEGDEMLCYRCFTDREENDDSFSLIYFFGILIVSFVVFILAF